MGRCVRLILPFALVVILFRSPADAAEPVTRPLASGWQVVAGGWEHSPAKGYYVLRLATTQDAKVKDLADLEVEGVPLLSNTSAMNRLAGSITILVEVTDGSLTISNAPTHSDQIAALEIQEAYAPERIVSWQTIGWSSPETSDRQVGQGIKQTGWAGFVKHVIEPEIRWGVRRIVVSNPFGCLPDEPMQFDQYLHARDAKLTWLTNGFARAWRPVTDRDVEVICYLGKLTEDPSFPPLARDRAGWEQRFWESVQPALDAKMSVALDAAAGDFPESHRAVDLLEAKGVKVYFEPRPNADAQRWFTYPIISVDTFWERSDPALHPDSRWAARNEQLTGEIIRIITAPPQGKTWSHKGWIGPYVRSILRDGHTAAAPVTMLMGEQIPLHELLRKDEPRPNPATSPSLDRNAPLPDDRAGRSTGNRR
jgi:hypothetical protein